MNILITGISGLLGKALESEKPENAEITGIHLHDYSIQVSDSKNIVLDVTNSKSIGKLFSENRFDFVIHCADIANVDYVETNESARLSNLKGTHNLVEQCENSGSFFIYVSTNAVFDGNNPPYAESSATNPINEYGKNKLECERLVAENLKNFATVRPILMYGWNNPHSRPNPATWIIDRLKKGEKTNLVDDVFENPLYNIQCAQAIWKIVDKRLNGIFHIAGAEILNRYEFGLKIAKTFDLDKNLISPVKSSFFPSIAPRPKNTSFSTLRMEKELGIKPLSISNGLKLMKEEMRK
jgi:dTDP-4-dehydrorhamnose reductase